MIHFGFIEKDTFGYYTISEMNKIGELYSEIHNEYDIIYGFKIEETFKKQGYGSYLLKKYLELKKNKNIFLHVQKSNISAISLYKKFGFVITEEILETFNYKPKYTDVYLMKR